MVGKSCHGLAIHFGLVADTVTCNILINLYTKCDQNDCARHVFYPMPTHSGEDMQVMKLFSAMYQEEMHMSEYTFSALCMFCKSMLSVNASSYTPYAPSRLHWNPIFVSRKSNSSVSTVVHDVYAKSNMIMDACWICEKMPWKSAVTWSSLLAG